MKHIEIASQAATRGYVLVFDQGEDVVPVLERFASDADLKSATFYGIGGFSRSTLAYYRLQNKSYDPFEIDEQVELISIAGNISVYQGKPKIHAHCAVAYADGAVRGGHLIAATVRPTLELRLDELPDALRREDSPEFRIPLLRL